MADQQRTASPSTALDLATGIVTAVENEIAAQTQAERLDVVIPLLHLMAEGMDCCERLRAVVEADA